MPPKRVKKKNQVYFMVGAGAALVVLWQAGFAGWVSSLFSSPTQSAQQVSHVNAPLNKTTEAKSSHYKIMGGFTSGRR